MVVALVFGVTIILRAFVLLSLVTYINLIAWFVSLHCKQWLWYVNGTGTMPLLLDWLLTECTIRYILYINAIYIQLRMKAANLARLQKDKAMCLGVQCNQRSLHFHELH